MTTSATTSKQSIIATGLFTAGGVDHPGDKVDRVVFPDGTFKIAHSSGIGTPHFNPKTCLGLVALNGTYRLSHGTGAYAGIRGRGIYRVNLTLVAARNAAGKCSDRSPPVAFQVIIRAQSACNEAMAGMLSRLTARSSRAMPRNRFVAARE